MQKELAEIPGCTVLIYDQTCAAEKRRRRKRGTFPDPDKRVIINELVCEGCGDCGVQSNCVSVQPLETEFGRKRTIDQSSCNKDYLLPEGLLPVVRHRARRQAEEGRGRRSRRARLPPLPEPDAAAASARPTTSSSPVSAAPASSPSAASSAWRRISKARASASSTWPASRRRAARCYSHMRIAERPEDIHAIRVAAGGADLVLGGDIVVAGNKKVLAAVQPGQTAMVVNMAEFLPGDFTRNADFSLPTERLKRAISTAAGAEHAISSTPRGSRTRCSARRSPPTCSWSAMPISSARCRCRRGDRAGDRAQRRGGGDEHAAFRWGRRAALDPAGVEALAKPAQVRDENRRLSQSFDEMVERRVAFLTAYQNAAYAARYRALVEKAKAAEAARAPGKCGLAEAVARYLFKLMAYKDEYEVARLYTDGAFLQQVASEFDGESCASSSISRRRCSAQARSDDRRAAQDERSARG